MLIFSSRLRPLLLSHAKLGLEGLGHGGRRGAGQAELDLDSVIDEPLESGEGSDHDDSGTQSSPHALQNKIKLGKIMERCELCTDFESEGLCGVSDAGSLGLVHVAHDGVGGMGDNGAEDTGDVSGSEGDNELLGLGALGPGLGDHVGINGLHSPLKAGELHHGVGDLSAPQGDQGLVEAIDTLILQDFGEGFPQSGGEGAGQRGLHPNLDRLHRRQSNVSHKLSRAGSGQIERGPVEVSVLFTHKAGVDVLEDLIESKLADSLGGVANGGGGPAKTKSLHSTLSYCDLEAITQGLVLLLVDLEPALDQVKGGHSGVSEATGQGTAHCAQRVVLG